MTNQTNPAEKLLEAHEGRQASVTFVSKDFGESGKAQWLGQETCASLKQAVELIISEDGNFAGCKLMVHDGIRDIDLAQSDILLLVDHVRSSNKPEI